MSVAVACPYSGDSSHSWFTSNGQVISGAVVSTIVIVWTHDDELSHASVAVHVLVITLSQSTTVSESS